MGKVIIKEQCELSVNLLSIAYKMYEIKCQICYYIAYQILAEYKLLQTSFRMLRVDELLFSDLSLSNSMLLPYIALKENE